MKKPVKKPAASANDFSTEHLSALPFVVDPGGRPNGEEGRHFWTVKRTGDQQFDMSLGEALAQQTLRTMRQHDCNFILRLIIRDMVAVGQFTGVEAGFVTELALEVGKREILARRIA
jgi:hypothetical protein